MKHTDGFIFMHLGAAEGQKPRTFWDPDGNIAFLEDVSPDDWLEEHYGAASLEELIGDLREDTYVASLLDRDPRSYGRDFAIMRVRVYEDGAIAVYGKARKGLGPEIGAEERPEAILTAEQIYQAHGKVPPIAAPKFEAGRHVCEVAIRITDRAEFEEHFGLTAGAGNDAVAAELAASLFTPFSDTPFGADLVQVEAEISKRTITARLTADISDASLFNQRVALAGRRSGFDDNWTPETAAAAIFEAWCGCNDTPSPDTIGLEFQKWFKADLAGDEITSPDI